ncbi:hypothetical protein [Virgibacillus sp. CBA3643]|uniref:hypothetical protein n=1 Tax=Virgibacillus sp. CBA3643 TaxID=2942278 RepID=UPI0035A3020F
MENIWKYNKTEYALYIEDKTVMNSIKRYYFKKGFKEAGVYFNKKGKIFAKQYLLPQEYLTTGKRLAAKGNK